MTRSIPLATPLALVLLFWPWNNLLAEALGTDALIKRRQLSQHLSPSASIAPRPLEHAPEKTHGNHSLHVQKPSLAQWNPLNILDTVGDWLGGAGDVADSVGDVAETVSNASSVLGKITGALGSIWDALTGNTGKDQQDNVFDNIQDVASKISNVSNAVDSIANIVGSLGSGIEGVVQALKKFTGPVQQGGHSQAYINRVLCLLVGFVLVVIVICYFWEKQLPQYSPSAGRPRLWLFGMLLSSYVMLIPGLVEALFSFTLAIELLGLHVTVSMSSDDTSKPGAITESMISVVRALSQTGSSLGAFVVILYAMVIPALKLLLLLVGEVWRFSEVPERVARARWCIRFVQMISKWACPDMFAYILLLYLLRSLDQGSSLLATPAHLDAGFSCFSIFCVCSTFSSLAIHLPDRPAARLEPSEGGAEAQQEAPEPVATMFEGKKSASGLIWIAGLLNIVFMVLYFVGLLLPCMALELKSSLLVKPQGPLPAEVMPFLRLLKLEDQVNSSVSLWECVCALLTWLYYGEANCILAVVMLGIFAMLLPVINMILLVIAAERAESQEMEDKPPGPGVGVMDIARIVKHISMLDVAVMGVVVVILAGQTYRQQGIVLSLRPGLLFLFLAEVVHYVTYYLVQSASLKAKTKSEAAS